MIEKGQRIDTEEKANEFFKELKDDFGGSPTRMEKHYGLAKGSICKRKNTAKKLLDSLGIDDEGEEFDPSDHIGFIPPDLPSDKMSSEQILDACEDEFKRRLRRHKATQWMPFKIKEDGPIALCFVGDPHIDDNGCNIPQLRSDVEEIAKANKATNAVWAVGLGDYINNWTGYLSLKKHPHQKVTRAEGWKLVEWLMKAMPWMICIKGNHDLWSKDNGTGDPLDWIANDEKVPMHDWDAKFKLVFPNGKELKIWAAHDFKGSSVWNPIHGPMKRAAMSKAADIYVCGDKHNRATYQAEDEHTNKDYTVIRARGYKYIDSFAEMLGFMPQHRGATVVVIIDPNTEHEVPCVTIVNDVKKAMKLFQAYRTLWEQENKS